MNWVTGVVLYVLIWWTALFAVLPFGTRPMADADPQTGWRGAPARARMLAKVAATTVIAGVLWAVCYLLISSESVSFRSGWLSGQPG